jgi:hypothetical protein
MAPNPNPKTNPNATLGRHAGQESNINSNWACKQTDKIQNLVAGNYSAPEPSPEDLFLREKPSSDIQNPNLFFLVTKPRKPQKHRNPIRHRKPAQMGT